ncbi:SDR family oxidoreductase [Amycolatopsis cihanbeyliensis]|uniref:Short-subunit dehydrogenase n=1 Tax=Amycolatopsis cihanbeyliensis TaxID=1128664 RepID=A0A542DQC7_AMYCI|nr:SDR family oxidoreductase [Amycolatopsis cihanbeyliensis]TQJ05155.1 short-subunit dehydrogenase [Amycolatopsis cihanbeyliensis]
MQKIWFITGSSRGFGRRFVESALERGDKVAATARDTETLADLVDTHGEAILPLALDVTDKAAVTETVKRAADHFGRLDVVVNNAGYGLFGGIEELSERDVRDQFETNVFGALWVTQEVLPYLREQGGGHIVQISSAGGVMSFPLLGGYHASKWALEGFSESLAQEVAGFGIKVTLVEPGGFATDWGGASATWSAPIAAYDGLRAGMAEVEIQQSDPATIGPALLRIVDAENPPLRVILGDQPNEMIKHVYAARLRTWAEWAALPTEATGS